MFIYIYNNMYLYVCGDVCAPSDLCSWFERVEGILTALLTFCQRNSSKLDTTKDKARQVTHLPAHTPASPLSSLQSLWFPTFDRVHDLQRKYKDSRNKKLVDCECILIIQA